MTINLSFKLSKSDWAELTGEQRLAVRLVQSILKDIDRGIDLEEITVWADETGVLSPPFIEALLELPADSIKRRVKEKLANAQAL